MMACRVDREATPAATDVQHPHSGFQFELAGNQLELRARGLLERLRPPGEDRAAVGHRLVQEEGEEVVADVVVVAHGGRVAIDAVEAAAKDQLEAWTPRNPAWRGRRGEGQAEADTIGGA